jgi:hypothetical protein
MVDAVNREHGMPAESSSPGSRPSKRARTYFAASTGVTHDREHSTANIQATHNREQSAMSIETTHNGEQSAANIEPGHNGEQSAANIETTHNGEQPAANIEPGHNGEQQSAATIINSSGQEARNSFFAPLYRAVGFDVDLTKQRLWPSAACLSSVLPVYLTRVTAKGSNGTTWVRVSYSTPTQSVLELFISPSAIQHVAKELYDLNITTKDQVRGVLLDNNIFIEMTNSIKLSGTPLDKLLKLFGTLAAEAHQSSPTRIQEISEGTIGLTYCLTMEIWPDADCPSRLTLKADVEMLSVISARLWPDWPSY